MRKPANWLNADHSSVDIVAYTRFSFMVAASRTRSNADDVDYACTGGGGKSHVLSHTCTREKKLSWSLSRWV